MLTKAADRAAMLPIQSCGKGEWLMSTYEEMMILLTFAMLIVSILNMKNK